MAGLERFQRLGESDEAFRARQRAEAALQQDRDPDMVLQSRSVARQTGQHPRVVESDWDGQFADYMRQRERAAIQQDPWVARFYGDPDNAAAGKKDVERLGRVSGLIAGEEDSGAGFRARMQRQLRPLTGSTILGDSNLESRYARPVDLREVAQRAQAKQAARQQEIESRQWSWTNPLAVPMGFATGTAANLLQSGVGLARGIVDDFAPEMSDDLFDPISSRIDFARQVWKPKGLSPIVGEGLYAAGQSLTDLFVLRSLGARSREQMLAGMGGMVGLTAYDKYRGRGAEPGEALSGALVEGGIEVVTEMLPLRWLEGALGSEGTKGFVSKFLAPELIGEQIAEHVQTAVDFAIENPGQGWDEYWDTFGERTLTTLVATTAMTGAIGGMSIVRQRLQREQSELIRGEQAVREGQFLDQLMEEAAGSEMKKLDPESLRAALDDRLSSSPIENVYIPVEAVRELMQSEGYEPGFFEDYAEQIEQAERTGGDVVVPLAAVAAHLSGTPTWDALREDVRVQPGGLSQREAREQGEEITRTLEQRGEEIAKEAAAEGAQISAAAEVYEEVRAQLLSIGRSSIEADRIAQLYAASRETWGKRLGMTAKEYHARNPVAFEDGKTGARAGGRTLKQDDAFQKWFGDSKVRDENGAPLVVYHGTSSNFDAFDMSRGGEVWGASDTENVMWFSSVRQRADAARRDALASKGEEEDGGEVLDVYLNLRNPLEVDNSEGRTSFPKEIEAAKRAGHDGLIITPGEFGGQDYVVFEPTQIKSTANRGTWDPSDPRILFQNDGPPSDALPAAGWTRERVSALIDTWGADGDRSKAWAAMIAPSDLLALATGEALTDTGVPQIEIDAKGEVVGFAGRAQVEALHEAGIMQVPVVISLREGETDDRTELNVGGRALADPVPITAKNYQRLVDMGNAARTFFQDPAAPFYSALERAIEETKTARAPAAQWKATLIRTPGVKQEELEWSGVFDWLDIQKGPVSREALLEVVRDRGIKVEEVVLGDKLNRISDAEIEALADSIAEERADDIDWDGDEGPRQDWISSRWGSFRDLAETQLEQEAANEPQFKDWSSDPSNDTYRELLITIPRDLGNNPKRAPSTHWDQEAVVAHARFMEKRDAEGKRVLFIEEIQSDWHQKGRDEGYEQRADPETLEAAQGKYDKVFDELSNKFVEAYNTLPVEQQWLPAEIPPELAMRGSLQLYVIGELEDRGVAQNLTDDLRRLQSERQLAGRELEIAKGNIRTGIPEAPFKSSWPALVMKRMIRWAVDNGYERVAWIRGEEQNGGRTGDSEGQWFYDRNLVNITNNIIKKYGAKVGAVNMPRPGYSKMIAGEMFPETKENPGFDITPALRDAAQGGFPLFQGERGKPRGQASFYSDGGAIITLFETANLSTLLHETSHFFLEELRANATAEGAPQEVIDDWNKVQAWFAEQKHPVVDGFIPTAAHELWARGGERYFMEGKAPTGELQAAFNSFKAWLTRIYQVVLNLRAPINPDIREVFDRLLATREEIDHHRNLQGTRPLFKTAEEAGMTDAEFAAYVRAGDEARTEAYDALLFKTMETIRKREQAKMREQRANVRREVTEEINAAPEFIALHLLRTGRWLGDPDRAKVDIKINSGWLIDTYGEAVLDTLPHGLPITRGDGLDGDQIAEMVGMASGTQLVEKLQMLRQKSDELRAAGETRSFRDKVIDDTVDRIMAERHGDPLNDGTIEEEAIAAINNARQGEIIASEARQLAKKSRIIGGQTPYQVAREWARRVVEEGKVIDVVSRAAMQRYIRAANKSARLAEKAILDGDVNEAYRQKQGQLLNHALLSEAKVAADRIDRIVDRMRTLGKRAAMKSVDQDYMDKVHILLEQFDLRTRSQRGVDEIAKFAEWARRQREAGFEVVVPPRLQVTGEHYSRVPVHELFDLDDTVKSILHLGKVKQHLIAAGEERDWQRFHAAVLERINRLPTRKMSQFKIWDGGKLRPHREVTPPINEPKRWAAQAASQLLKVETIVEELDGGPTGPLHDLLIRGATDAANMRDRLRDMVSIPIANAYNALDRKQWQRLQEKVTIPELTWNRVNEGDPRRGTVVTITRMELLTIFLNMGNNSNFEKLSRGEIWPIPTLRAVMARELKKEDYDLAQTLWTQINLLWPEIVRVERGLTGVVPEQVTAVPIETPFGTYEGGYWPVVYDSARSQRAENNETPEMDFFGTKAGIGTPKGHTITRTDAVGPMNLSIEHVLFNHIEKVISRIAYAEYARDVLRTVRDDRIRGLINTKLGSEYREQFEKWLARQIHEGAAHTKAAAFWQSKLRHARINMTTAAMGFRISTGAAQTLGLGASAQRIGPQWVAHGLRRMTNLVGSSGLVAGAATGAMVGGPLGAFIGGYAGWVGAGMAGGAFGSAATFVEARSEEWVRRSAAVNREMVEVFGKLRGKHSRLAEAQAWAFWHIGMIDRYLVAMPTWLGAHARGLSEGMTDAEASAYADKSVRLSQGSGREKDLSAFQSPNDEAMRFFTMFYTPFNVMFNAQWQAVRGIKKGDLRPAIGVTFWWLIATTLADALMSGDFPEGEEGWAAWFTRNVFFGMFAGIPLGRDLAGGGERKLMGEYADIGATPLTRIYDAIEKAMKMTGDVVAGDEVKKPIKNTADTVAILGGVPVSQFGVTAQYLWDYSEGEVDPETLSDWYFGLTRGREPEQE